MAQQLRTKADFLRDLGSITSTHVVTQKIIHGIQPLLLASEGSRHLCGAITHTGKISRHIKQK